ncbi:MAG: tetratricopeptide repeat protein [Pirellulales bacterium]
MYKLCCLLGLLATLTLSVRFASAADRVKPIQGNPTSGKLAEMSATKVILETGTAKKEFAVNEIELVQFDGEPSELMQARLAVASGRYDDALTVLAKIEAGELKRAEIARDVEFYQALAAARLALAGGGSVAEAGKKMFAFERANRDNFHYFDACQALGDLLAALGRYADAEGYYAKLAEAPWPDYKMRAGVLLGRSLVNQQKFDQAAAKFDEVLKTDATGKEADSQKAAAALGQAAAFSGAGKTDEALKLVDDVIAKADPENEELHARAYNILGNCHKAAGKKKEALLAFLHVDLLYSRHAEQHAEALANLAILWSEVDKSDRAAQAKNLLKEKYPNSVWAAK